MITGNIENIINSIPINKVEVTPSVWAEKHRYLTSDVSTLQGKFNYDLTPYLREVVDTLSPYHPAKIVAIMKAAQIGFTEGVMVNGILWIIANNPGNIMALAANDDLSKEMVESRLDQGIASCGLQHLIRPNTIRKRNNRTGDTSRSKEYAGGRLFAGSVGSVDKLGKQRSIKTGFFDDWDSAPVSDKEQGNIFDLLQQRFSTAAHVMKQYYISTPENKPSNIESVYLKGDQRKWHIPCPVCGEYIEILWYKKKNKERYGIIYDVDKNNRLIESSVGYKCQKCGGFWTEDKKYESNLHGKWIPTAEPDRPGIYSYHIPAFCAAPNMYGWTHYAYQWLDIYKRGNESKSKLRVFKNLVMGESFEETKQEIKKSMFDKNKTDYKPMVVPCELSRIHGNGEIVLLTCSADMNGIEDDARLDYEVVAHTEAGSTYSIDQGSIGTYQPGMKNEKRRKYTYKNDAEYNVWDIYYNDVINAKYQTDEGKTMRILVGSVDAGYLPYYAYQFVDKMRGRVLAFKGRGEDKMIKTNADLRPWVPAKERSNLYIIEVDLIKDELAERITLQWTKGNHQPYGFLNFPKSDGTKYKNDFFSQYSSEHKILEKNDDGDVVGWKWKKIKTTSQNHFWDCGVYNIALKHIISYKICKEGGIKYPSWLEFCEIMKKVLKKI